MEEIESKHLLAEIHCASHELEGSPLTFFICKMGAQHLPRCVAVKIQGDGQVFSRLFGQRRTQYLPWPAGVTQRLALETLEVRVETKIIFHIGSNWTWGKWQKAQPLGFLHRKVSLGLALPRVKKWSCVASKACSHDDPTVRQASISPCEEIEVSRNKSLAKGYGATK